MLGRRTTAALAAGLLFLALGCTSCSVPTDAPAASSAAVSTPASAPISAQTSPAVSAEHVSLQTSDTTNILIASFSDKSGSIDQTAQLLHEATGGTLLETALAGSAAELLSADSLSPYAYIVLLFPLSEDGLPPDVQTFLEKNDFEGKTLLPVIESTGSGADAAIQAIQDLQPSASVDADNALVLSADAGEGDFAIMQWLEELQMTQEDQLPKNGQTVLSALIDPEQVQSFYLWEQDNMPSETIYTENSGAYADDPDFRPYVVFHPVPEGTEIKGAVLICAGGAFMFRSDDNEGTPVAQELAKRGYQSFVVNYRLRPYTQKEGALDLARAVRFVRANAQTYGIDEEDIAVMGFSAGGILAGEMLLNYDGLINGTALDPDYVPDDLDAVSADASADGMIYSFYGVLSRGITDPEILAEGDLPPTFYCYGTRDPFYEQFMANAQAAEQAGVEVEQLELPDRPHGFGWREDWIDTFDDFLTEVFAANAQQERAG